MNATKKTRRRRILLAALLTLVLCGAALRLVLSPAAPPPPPTLPVALADIEDTVLATGKIEALKMVSVGAQASGQIKSLKVALGDLVKKGQLVAEIDSLTQQNALHTAEASLENSRAQRRSKEAVLKQSELAFQRQRQMLAEDASTRESFESAEATLNGTKADIAALDAQIRQAVIAVDTAKVNLGYTRITAPIDGTVVGVVVKEGQTVNATQTTPTLIKIAQLDTMTVKAELSEADVIRVVPGQRVYFTVLGEPDRRYDAILRAVKPAPDSIADEDSTSSSSSSSSSSGSSGSSSSSSSSSAIYYDGLFDIANPEGKLRISMTAKVTIVLKKVRGALTVPSTVLGIPDPDGSYMLQVVDGKGKISPRRVHIGIDNNVNAEVLDGLAVGERIVAGDMTKATTGQSNMRPPPPMGF